MRALAVLGHCYGEHLTWVTWRPSSSRHAMPTWNQPLFRYFRISNQAWEGSKNVPEFYLFRAFSFTMTQTKLNPVLDFSRRQKECTMLKGSQRCFYSDYDTGHESLPVDNQDSFQSKYLYFNGLSTLPRKPRPKHYDVDISNQVNI